jgi:hypothetical protein
MTRGDAFPALNAEPLAEFVDGDTPVERSGAHRQFGMLRQATERGAFRAALTPELQVAQIETMNDQRTDGDRKLESGGPSERFQIRHQVVDDGIGGGERAERGHPLFD